VEYRIFDLTRGAVCVDSESEQGAALIGAAMGWEPWIILANVVDVYELAKADIEQLESKYRDLACLHNALSGMTMLFSSVPEPQLSELRAELKQCDMLMNKLQAHHKEQENEQKIARDLRTITATNLLPRRCRVTRKK
jgi:hypothetical protein